MEPSGDHREKRLFDVGRNVLGHFEHGHLGFAAENSFQGGVGVDHTLVFLVLELVLLDVVPDFFGEFSARHGGGTDNSGECGVRLDGFEECRVRFAFGFGFGRHDFVGFKVRGWVPRLPWGKLAVREHMAGNAACLTGFESVRPTIFCGGIQDWTEIFRMGMVDGMHPYAASAARYDETDFHRRAGASGLFLPRLSLGLWHNFGAVDAFGTQRAIVLRAFDRGITHFDLANNYGPPPGAAEENFGRILAGDLKPYRDELVISTKAGYRMWPGPYGEWGSKKYLLASLDQSLRRLGLDSVDIFYSHRFDPGTPLEETMEALACAVRSGKALYAGLSSYPPAETRRACAILRAMGVRPLLHQPSYNMLDRHLENGLLDTIAAEGMGCVVFCPLAQGLLTDRYQRDIPEDSRAAKAHGFLQTERVTESHRGLLKSLQSIAGARGQSIAQLALAWALRDTRVTSAIIGVSSLAQLDDNLAAMKNSDLSKDEREAIESALANR